MGDLSTLSMEYWTPKAITRDLVKSRTENEESTAQRKQVDVNVFMGQPCGLFAMLAQAQQIQEGRSSYRPKIPKHPNHWRVDPMNITVKQQRYRGSYSTSSIHAATKVLSCGHIIAMSSIQLGQS